MSDRLDEALARFQPERPPPDLAPRIVAAVARRRQARAMWRRVGLVTASCALAGLFLVWFSWSHAADSLDHAVNAIQTNNIAQAINSFLDAPTDTVAGWLDAGLDWQAAETESVGLALMLGIALLSVAAFGGLARLLDLRAPNGYSH